MRFIPAVREACILLPSEESAATEMLRGQIKDQDSSELRRASHCSSSDVGLCLDPLMHVIRRKRIDGDGKRMIAAKCDFGAVSH